MMNSDPMAPWGPQGLSHRDTYIHRIEAEDPMDKGSLPDLANTGKCASHLPPVPISREKAKAQIRREVIRDLKREQKAAEDERLRQEKEAAKAIAKAQREQEKKKAKQAKARAEREALKASQSASSHPPIDEQSAAILGPSNGLGGPNVAPWD